ncbi:hypothetical protein BJX68DRAFT_255286 [Aspergillus pseudodeflectus]|uniref:Uncharacterized protein n=1 Tax=Aspergillus pseudodeflectus TaxID=176178 RepID=A0ABR4KFE8_9EURO
MHWVDGTWLWAKHRATRSTSNPIHLEREPNTSASASSSARTRANRPRTWSLPTYQPLEGGHRRFGSTSTPPSGPRSRSDSSVTSSSRGTQTGAGLHNHLPAPLQLSRMESCSAACGSRPYLLCIRCGRYRSRTYHYLHFDDPVMYPERGICSRERTLCARVKAREQLAAEKREEMELELDMEKELGLDGEAGREGGGADIGDDVYELPDTSTESMNTRRSWY